MKRSRIYSCSHPIYPTRFIYLNNQGTLQTPVDRQSLRSALPPIMPTYKKSFPPQTRGWIYYVRMTDVSVGWHKVGRAKRNEWRAAQPSPIGYRRQTKLQNFFFSTAFSNNQGKNGSNLRKGGELWTDIVVAGRVWDNLIGGGHRPQEMSVAKGNGMFKLSSPAPLFGIGFRAC